MRTEGRPLLLENRRIAHYILEQKRANFTCQQKESSSYLREKVKSIATVLDLDICVYCTSVYLNASVPLLV